MKKNEDLTKLSKKELTEKIKDLKNKEGRRCDIGKITALFSLSFGTITALALAGYMIPFLVCVGAAAAGILTGWGFYASSINCSLKIDEINKEINSRANEEYTQLAMDTFLKETKVNKHKKTTNKDFNYNNDDTLSL